ncbi:MAG: toll/interleukin-1 receptor domain-containing protein [Gammaproteobacteria bacterium]|nr:toll/interleukin-1 receptor domain-containing protein [Gammaproteobacteria bacterium]
MIFISYRKNDEPGYVGRLADGLRQRFGTQHVFQDLDDIVAGENWQPQIESTLKQSHIVLAIIGTGWEKELLRRINAANLEPDIHQHELVIARKLKIPIIPVLLRNAALPDRDKLGELDWLLDGHAFRLHDGQNQWQLDLDKLASQIETATGLQQLRAPVVQRHWSLMLFSAVALLSLAIGILLNRPDEQGDVTADDGHASNLPMPLGEVTHNWEATGGLSVLLDATTGSDAEHYLNNLKFPAGTGKQRELVSQFCHANANCIECVASPTGVQLTNAALVTVTLINNDKLVEEEMKTADQKNVWSISDEPHLWENIDKFTGRRTIYSCAGD